MLKNLEFWSIFILLVPLIEALNPVKDFRSHKIGNSKKKVPSKASKLSGIKNYAGSVQSPKDDTSSTIAITTTSSLSSLAPTIELSENIHIVSTDESNAIYYLNTTITDSKTNYNETLPLLLDTGSANSWAYNESCSSDACKAVYRFDDSKASIKTESTFELVYSGDKISGDLINTSDNNLNFSIDGLSLNNFTLGLTDESPSMFDDYKVSGIIGVSSSSSSKNYISQLYESNLIDQPIFGLSLVSSDQTIKYLNSNNKQSNLPSDYGGLVIFGSQASKLTKKFTEKDLVVYTDISDNDNSYWLINVTEITSHNDSASADIASDRQALIDTGTTGLALPKSDADSLHSKLFGSSLVTDNSGNYAFLCNDTNSNITFTINDHDFNLSLSDFKGNEYSGSGLDGYCASKIQGLDDNDYWILGAAFLSKFYTIFDLSKKKIGFADSRITTYAIKETPKVFSSETVSSSSSTRSKNGSHTSTQARASSSATSKNNSTSSSSKDSGARDIQAGLHNLIPFQCLIMVLAISIFN